MRSSSWSRSAWWTQACSTRRFVLFANVTSRRGITCGCCHVTIITTWSALTNGSKRIAHVQFVAKAHRKTLMSASHRLRHKCHRHHTLPYRWSHRSALRHNRLHLPSVRQSDYSVVKLRFEQFPYDHFDNFFICFARFYKSSLILDPLIVVYPLEREVLNTELQEASCRDHQ